MDNYYKSIREKGLCYGCKKPAEKTYCEECKIKLKTKRDSVKDVTNAKSRAKRKEREFLGLCKDCATPVEDRSYVRCSSCRKKRTDRNIFKRKILNKCVSCGKRKTVKRVRCQDCSERIRKRKAEAKANGLCWYCGEPAVNVGAKLDLNYKQETNSRCQTCYLKYISRDHFHCGSKWEQLLELFKKQGGKCPYTGKQLTLGRDAELDHIYPRCRGGSIDDFANLQWVWSPVNRIKWKFTDGEFLKFIKTIYEYRF